MYNEFVKMYCKHYGLDIVAVDNVNVIFEDGQKIGSFDADTKIITFDNGTTVRKGDLMLSIIECTSLHN